MEVPGFKLGRRYDFGQHYQSFSALNLKNHKTVDIQLFNPSLVANQTFKTQFKKISQKLIDSDFGIITPILHAEISDDVCYVITEHHACTEKIPSTGLNSKKSQVLQIALKISESLAALHKLRLVHGGLDLSALCFKSPDLLILKPPKLQLVIPLLRQTTFKAMTPAQRQYLAPEAYDDLTPATDYYALGVLAYQLLLFMQLLTEDPRKRIQSHEQFKAAIQRCGNANPASKSFYNRVATKVIPKAKGAVKTSNSLWSWMIPATGIAVTALAGTIFFSLTHEAKLQNRLPELERESVAETGDFDKNGLDQTPSVSNTDHRRTSVGFNKLIQSALTQSETSPKTALRIINVALKQKPDDADAISLKQRIEQQIEIDSIFEDAEFLLSNMQLLTPEGDNAYEAYQTLARLLSPDDERVLEGFTRIAVIYYALAENELGNNQLDKALAYIDLGLSVKSEYPQLLQLRSSIIERQNMAESESLLAKHDQQQRRREQQLTDELIRNQTNQIKQTKQTSRHDRKLELGYEQAR
ncbi:MAG: hypothetical protein ABW100_04005 [Candidatus Thiodiazotropha sp. 6PLUC3]